MVQNPRFILDSSLGKLTKWLRILGFDAQFTPGPPVKLLFSHSDEKRIILTRAKRMQEQNPGIPLVFIKADNPKDQLRQVIEEMNIRFSDINPFSRCLTCNCPVSEIPKRDVRGIVPDYVYETQEAFKQCPRCNRIYWPGTHISRGRRYLQELFDKPMT